MKRRRILCVFSALVLLLSGCSVRRIGGEKQQDLDYKTLDRLGIPEKLWKEVEEKKEEPFLLAYGDGEQLYIAMGYGEQESGGYSIQIEEVCETEDAVCIRTCLTGPDEGEKVSQEPDCPYAAVATEYTEKRILWER